MRVDHRFIGKFPDQFIIAVNFVNRMVHVADYVFYFFIEQPAQRVFIEADCFFGAWKCSEYTGSGKALHVYYFIIAAFTDESTEKKFTGDGEDDAVPSAAASGRTALKEIIDALIPYSERHLSRMERLVQDSYMIDYILGEMDGGVFDAEFSDDEDDSMDVDLIRS